MATKLGRDASVYWNSGSLTASLVAETRNVAIDLGTDFAEDTVHGDTVRTYAPLYSNFNASVTGLYNSSVGTGVMGSKLLIDHALAKASGTWSIYLGTVSAYFCGSGYIGVDNVGAPYDDFAPFDWSIRSLGTVTFTASTS